MHHKVTHNYNFFPPEADLKFLMERYTNSQSEISKNRFYAETENLQVKYTLQDRRFFILVSYEKEEHQQLREKLTVQFEMIICKWILALYL